MPINPFIDVPKITNQDSTDCGEICIENKATEPSETSLNSISPTTQPSEEVVSPNYNSTGSGLVQPQPYGYSYGSYYNIVSAVLESQLPVQVQDQLVAKAFSSVMQTENDIRRHHEYSQDSIAEDLNKAKLKSALDAASHADKMKELEEESRCHMEENAQKHEQKLAEIAAQSQISVMRDFDCANIDVAVYEDPESNLVARIHFNATDIKKERILIRQVHVNMTLFRCVEEEGGDPFYEIMFRQEQTGLNVRLLFAKDELSGAALLKRLKSTAIEVHIVKKYQQQLGDAILTFLQKHCQEVWLHAFNGWNISKTGFVFVPLYADSMNRRSIDNA